VESKALLQGADKLWQLTFSAKRAILLAAFGYDPTWRMAWALGEKTLRWHLIDSLRIDPGYIGPSTGMISPQFGFEATFNERGEPQGYRMVSGQQLHDLFLKLTSFLARVQRYSAGCDRDEPLERLARLLNVLEQRTKGYYSQQIRIQDYVADAKLARPKISARLASDLEAQARGPDASQETGAKRALLAERVRAYEVRRWSALPWLRLAEE
jgi:hypothetical protein